MKIPKILTLFLIAIITATAASAQEAEKVQKIDALLKNYYVYGQLNGAILVSENGKVIYKKGFGMANMEWEIPVQTDTKFRIASVTKQFTAALISLLIIVLAVRSVLRGPTETLLSEWGVTSLA